jgi:hypothetical protein
MMLGIKMNLYKSSNKFCVFLAASCLLLVHGSYAVDFEGLQNQCAELGFKIKTPENGKCVLKLRNKIIGLNNESSSDSVPVISQSIEAANQRNYERQQKYAKDAEIEQKNREIEILRQQQQAQLISQQQAQQAQNRADNASAAMLFLLGAAAGAYNKPAPPPLFISPPSPPINCTSRLSLLGNRVDTNCW